MAVLHGARGADLVRDPRGPTLRPRLAGWWYLLVALPVFQFILLRWYFRLFIWTRFLWHVSRLPLAYAPMHPDRMGGIGFLSRVGHAFAPLLLAQGALLAGSLANKILYTGATLPSFQLEIAAVVAVVVFVVLGPLLVFMLPLAAAKRKGMREYGHIARRYVDEFDAKWLRGAPPPDEPFVGSADIQSLADMGNSFEVVRSMRTIPITPRHPRPARRHDAAADRAAAPDHRFTGRAAQALPVDRVLKGSR